MICIAVLVVKIKGSRCRGAILCYLVRLTYDQGRLEVMSPTSERNHLADTCTLMAHLLGEETGCEVESFGRTTFKQARLNKGAEPDACFYVQSAAE